MKFLKIEWKNIFSYGNKIETLEFDESGSLWQLCGATGSGKTSIIQLPYLLLYGETINGATLQAIPNRTNRNGSFLKGYIQHGDDLYEITRTFSPHALSIYKNESEISLPGIDAKQDYIKNNIMDGIPKSVYKNIMTLSLNKDISFIDMGAKDKRSILDFIMDMEVLNYYSELLKKDNAAATQSINESNGSISVLDRNLRRYKDDLEQKKNLLNAQEESNVEEGEIKEKIETINKQFKLGRLEYINELNGKIQELQSKKSELSSKVGSCFAKINQLNNQLKLLMQDKCPTCGSSFKTPEFQTIRENIQNVIDSTNAEMGGYNDDILKLDSSINSYRSEIITKNNEIATIDNKIQELNNKLLSSEKYKNAKTTYESVDSEVKRLENEVKSEERKVSEKENDVRLYGILKTIYGDNGVKKILRDKYMPELNREINKSLSLLEIPYSVTFDANFEAKFSDRGDEIQVATLSKGEKQRANIAVLYSLIKIVKNRYPNINIIALDETTSNVDYETGMEVFKFFKEIADDLKVNIFVATHTEIIDDSIFNHRLFIEKNDGFSKITKR